MKGLYEGDDVGQVFHARDPAGHAGSQLQFDQRRQTEVSYSVDFDTGLGRIGEGDGLGLAVAGELAGNEKLDADAGRSVLKIVTAGERSNVSQAVQLPVKLLPGPRPSPGCPRPR